MAPSEQKALVLDTPGGDFAVKTWSVPKPQAGEVLVKVLATALNPIEWKIHAWKLPLLPYPAILGNDAAGEVVELGEGVTSLKLGDKIICQGTFSNDRGTFQQYMLANASLTAKIPSTVSLDDAASIPAALATAFLGLFNAKSDKQGGGAALEPFWKPTYSGAHKSKPFLVQAGASSSGQYAIQLAKLAGFSPIIATASEHNAAFLKSIGATHILPRDLSPAELKQAVSKVTSAQVTVIYDGASLPETLTASWALLAPGGKLIHVLGAPEEIKAGQDGKELTWMLGNVNAVGQGEVGQELYAQLEGWLRDGSIKPNRVQVLPDGLAGIPAGLKLLQAGKVSGTKLVAHPQE